MPRGETQRAGRAESRARLWPSATWLFLQQEGRNPGPAPANPPGLGFAPVPYLPDQRLPLGGVYEQTPSQTFIERPVGAPWAGAADARVLGMQQRVSVFPSTARTLPPAMPA